MMPSITNPLSAGELVAVGACWVSSTVLDAGSDDNNRTTLRQSLSARRLRPTTSWTSTLKPDALPSFSRELAGAMVTSTQSRRTDASPRATGTCKALADAVLATMRPHCSHDCSVSIRSAKSSSDSAAPRSMPSLWEVKTWGRDRRSQTLRKTIRKNSDTPLASRPSAPGESPSNACSSKASIFQRPACRFTAMPTSRTAFPRGFLPSYRGWNAAGMRQPIASNTAGLCHGPSNLSATRCAGCAIPPACCKSSFTSACNSVSTGTLSSSQHHASGSLPRPKSRRRSVIFASRPASRVAASLASSGSQGSARQKPYFRSVREALASKRHSKRRRARKFCFHCASWKCSQAGRSVSKTMWVGCLVRVIATNPMPGCEAVRRPILILALRSVMPCAFQCVKAHAKTKGNWLREILSSDSAPVWA